MDAARTPVMESPPGPYTLLDGRRYLYFAGTGYLGLQGHPEVIRAACEAAARYGIGSATSRTGFGNVPPTLEVERQAAEFFGAEAAFYFASGYAGNHILALLLEDAYDAVFIDALAHYSVCEAARLSHRPVFRFAHRDPEDLAGRLQAHLRGRQRPLVISDGVFSVRGTIAPAAEYCRVLGGYPGAMLLLDDAHAFGVLGAHGRGTFEHVGLTGTGVNLSAAAAAPCPEATPAGPDRATGGVRLYLCGTCSKALGGYGGIIPGSGRFIEHLKQTSPYYGGASAPPVPVAAATARALELVRTDPGLRRRLRENVSLLKGGLRRMGLEADDSPVPIVCLELGTAEDMRRIQRGLRAREIMIAYVPVYAGVSAVGALRLAVFANHDGSMIEQLLDELRRLL